MISFEPAYSTIVDITQILSTGTVTSVEIVEKTFARIKKLDPHLNAFVCLTEDRALEEARATDVRRSNGASLGPLDGVPYAVKDIYNISGVATMAGSLLLTDNIADSDCAAVRCLAAAGMVLVGKTHTVQFAATINGTNPDFGTPHNPWNEVPHLPGGSSSGSAVAVAAGMVPVALGSDTAGSIRVPAALTGITGFKPTGGRLGRGGVRPLSLSLDAIGPLTRTVQDAAQIFEAMQGVDPEDETTWTTPLISPSETIDGGIEGLNIVVCESVFFDDCDPLVIEAVEAVAEVLAKLGASVSHASIPEIEETLQRNREGVVISTEAYAVNRTLLEEHRDALDPLGFWMEAGKDISGVEYYQGLRDQFDLQRRFSDRMSHTHAILAPTCAVPTWPVDKLNAGGGPPVPYSRNTGIGNYLNISSVSFPCGFSAGGLPIGAMICTRPFDDEIALRIAQAYQQSTHWHTKRPDLAWISG